MIDTNQPDDSEFAAFIGIDWADQKHAWALRCPTALAMECGHLDHTPEAVDRWAAECGGLSSVRLRPFPDSSGLPTEFVSLTR